MITELGTAIDGANANELDTASSVTVNGKKLMLQDLVMMA